LHPGLVLGDNPQKDNSMESKMSPMNSEEIAAAAVYMACQPPHVNVLELIQLPKDQPYLGRG